VRRLLLPTALLAVAAVAGVLALRPPTEPPAAPPATSAVTPVLSLRRAPEALSAFVADRRLGVRLDAFLADPSLADGRNRSCLVVQQGARAVYEHDASRLLIPASNLKLVTAVAALTRLGPATTLATTVRGAAPQGGVVSGPLWVVGGGDPLLATKAYADSFDYQPQLHTSYEQLADRVVAAGVKHVTGGVQGDDSRYDGQRYLPSWRTAYATGGHVGPQSALAVNDGFVSFKPAKRVVTPDPPGHAAAVFTDLLRARGVVVDGGPGAGQAPGGVGTLATVASPPVSEMVSEMLRESDNNTAELLVKEMGKRFGGAGTTAAGLSIVQQALGADGLPSAEVSAVDGSGLDRSDKATCHLFSRILETSGPTSPIAAGLAVAGRTGTLFDRFVGNPAVGRLRAKTGFLDGVVGLSGWMDGTRGGDLVFAFLANGLPVPTEAPGYGAQEKLGAILAAYPEAPAPDQLAPR
jgi:D-alanyl-D-alanine carboxypeptidase/D-alanyl-D-alanine-endopeptidase (penicillin-binding protein 4)